MSSNPKLWLHEIGIFEVVPNKGTGDCLFQAISNCLSSEQLETPLQIRRRIVHHIVTKEWRRFGERILRFWHKKLITTGSKPSTWDKWIRNLQIKRSRSKKSIKNQIKQKYKKRMNQCNEPGTFYELLGAGDLYDFHLEYITPIDFLDEYIIPYNGYFRIFSCRTNGCNVRKDRPKYMFSFTRLRKEHVGHWEFMKPLLLLKDTNPLNRKIFGLLYNDHDNDSEVFTNDKTIEEEYHKILNQIDPKCLVHPNDMEWPPDECDDFVGCNAQNFEPELFHSEPDFTLVKSKGQFIIDFYNTLKRIKYLSWPCKRTNKVIPS